MAPNVQSAKWNERIVWILCKMAEFDFTFDSQEQSSINKNKKEKKRKN